MNQTSTQSNSAELAAQKRRKGKRRRPERMDNLEGGRGVKICHRCRKEKPLNDFGASTKDGFQRWCRMCKREYDHDNRARFRERALCGQRAWRKRNPDRLPTYNTKAGKQRRKEHPDRVQCRNITASAIRGGLLVRQPCEKCGDTNSQAHHDDYSEPLQVRWLCRKHHDKHHQYERRNEYRDIAFAHR